MSDLDSGQFDPGALEAEDAKLVTLARSARLRAYVPRGGDVAAEGAAVRDADGRTYAAATMENADGRLTVSALRAAVAAAASSGARRFEAAAVVSARVSLPDARRSPDTPDTPDADDLLTLGEFGAGVPVYLAGPDGVAHGRVTT
ncbi:cytidine deaminase [Frankia sp. Cppng1_Ct_nod]|uniref:cytidine deaminase n=1 Tax=Frankia sp. Cppng1_Ct_nod TaxID=2897162 RepID=UPI001F5E455B|nr:cytidine deaminase [Frankia sp. Cppng1_Ct_nod]